MSNQYKTDRIAANKAANLKHNLEALEAWFSEHPEIVPCDANRSLLRGYMADALEDVISDPSSEFTFAAQTLGANLARTAPITAEAVAVADSAHRAKLKLPTPDQQTRKGAREELPLSFQGVDISTPQALRAVARNRFELFKFLATRYGSEALDARMGVVAAPRQGQSIGLKF